VDDRHSRSSSFPPWPEGTGPRHEGYEGASDTRNEPFSRGMLGSDSHPSRGTTSMSDRSETEGAPTPHSLLVTLVHRRRSCKWSQRETSGMRDTTASFISIHSLVVSLAFGSDCMIRKGTVGHRAPLTAFGSWFVGLCLTSWSY